MLLSRIVAQRQKVTRRGHIHWTLCPFHNDRHPSLAIWDEDNHYHCFACEAHGNAVHWLMRVEKLSFHEAKKKLGEGFTPSRSMRSYPRTPSLAWPQPGVEYAETALLRERLVSSRWSDENVLLSLWKTAPPLSDQQLRLLHPYAQDLVLSRLRKIYPKS